MTRLVEVTLVSDEPRQSDNTPPHIRQSILEGVRAQSIHTGDITQTIVHFTQQVSGLRTQLLPLELPLPDEPPLYPLIFARRAELVQTLLTMLSEVTWLHVMGATGMGKTSAAALVAETHGPPRVAWLSLRGAHSGEEAARHFDLQLLRLASSPDRLELADAYGRGALRISELVQYAARRLGASGLVVIDDLPDLLRIGRLGEKLVALTMALEASGGKLLTTAQRGLTALVQGHLGTLLVEHVMPAMTPQDIDEVLASAGAPSRCRKPGFLSLMYAATHGHPSLVLATITYLRRNAWVINVGSLPLLLTGDPTREVRGETRRELLQLLPNDDARELLYRVSLIGVPFNNILVQVVAAVPPAIARPAELLPELVGPWVHHVAADRYEVSPLLCDAGHVILDGARQRHVHRAVAVHYLQQGTIDLDRGHQILLHLLGAGEWFKLTYFLMQLVSQFNEQAQAEAFEFVTFFFESLWPDEIPLSLRILFRAIQVRLLYLLNRDTDALVTDLDRMIQQVDVLRDPSAFLAVMLIGPMNPVARPAVIAQRALQSSRLYAQLPAEIQMLSATIPRASLVWIGIPRIQTRDDIRGILSVLADMDAEERQAACSGELFEGPRLFVDQCLLVELKKVDDEQDWEGVLSLLDEILLIAQQPGGESLRAPVAHAKAIVVAEHMARVHEALAILQAAHSTDDHNARFLLHYTAGCILFDHSTPEASLDRYQRALAESPTTCWFQHFDALRRGSEAAGRAGQWQVMQDLAVQSLQPLSEDDLFYEKLEMIGELAWAHWSLGKRVHACGAMAGLLRRLMKQPSLEADRCREVFRKTQHVLGWMMAVVEFGNPPRQTVAGGPYIEPFPGFFSRPRPQLAESSLPFTSQVLLLSQLGVFAVGCGLLDFGWRTLNDAKHLAESQHLVQLQSSISWRLAELAAQQEHYETALSLALPAIRAFPLSSHAPDYEASASPMPASLEELWMSVSEGQRKDFERTISWVTIGPAIARLLARNASTDTFDRAIATLETIFQQPEHVFEDRQYWLHLLHQIRHAFSAAVTREKIYAQIQHLSASEIGLYPLFCLAVSHTLNATLEECCATQARAFEILLRSRPLSQPMINDIASYLMHYWNQVSKTRAFALQRPQVFRRAVLAIQKPSVANAASLLLLAGDATGVKFPTELHSVLHAQTLTDVQDG